MVRCPEVGIYEKLRDFLPLKIMGKVDTTLLTKKIGKALFVSP